jgi:hypothetical protein
MDGGIIDEGWIEKFRKKMNVSYSGQSFGIRLDVLWKNRIILFMAASVTRKIRTEQIWSRVIERINAPTACLRARRL